MTAHRDATGKRGHGKPLSWDEVRQRRTIIAARRRKVVLRPGDFADLATAAPQQAEILRFFRQHDLAGQRPPTRRAVGRHLGYFRNEGVVRQQLRRLMDNGLLVWREGRRYDILEKRKKRLELTDLGRAVADQLLYGDEGQATLEFHKETPQERARAAGEVYIVDDES